MYTAIYGFENMIAYVVILENGDPCSYEEAIHDTRNTNAEWMSLVKDGMNHLYQN